MIKATNIQKKAVRDAFGAVVLEWLKSQDEPDKVSPFNCPRLYYLVPSDLIPIPYGSFVDALQGLSDGGFDGVIIQASYYVVFSFAQRA